MPDSVDYEWLGWLLAHPDEWSADDLANAETILVVQREAVAATHPKDNRGRERMQAVVDQLESAIREHRAPGARDD